MNYSICLLDESGQTKRSEMNPYDDDAAALAYARSAFSGHHVIEIWKGEALVARLLEDKRDGAVR